MNDNSGGQEAIDTIVAILPWLGVFVASSLVSEALQQAIR